MEYALIIIYLIVAGITMAIYKKVNGDYELLEGGDGLLIGLLWPLIILASPVVLLIYVGYWITNNIIK